MRLMVTGGAGYIGAHVVVELLGRGHEVVVVDDLRAGDGEAVARAQAIAGRSCAFHRLDVANVPAMRNVLRGVDVVVHLAADKLVDDSMARPERTFHNNLGGLTGLARAMADAGVTRLVYSSSAAVYGAQTRMPIAEDAPLVPDSPYGCSKLQGEQILDWIARRRGWSVVSLRYFNPVGAHPSGRIGQPLASAAALVPRALLAVAGRGPPLTVFGDDYPTPDGTCLRDYIHVSDLARAHSVALAGLAEPGHEIYNVGTGRTYSVREVLAACARATGRAVPVVMGARRPGDIVTSVADPSRFRAATGFEAKHGLDEMVTAAWRWCTLCPDGYGQGRKAG